MSETSPAVPAFGLDDWAESLVALHDEQGLPLEISLQMSAEFGLPVSLPWLLAAMARRNWGTARLREATRFWRSNLGRDLTAGETRALAALVVGG